jgi:dienelactone hydrolase
MSPATQIPLANLTLLADIVIPSQAAGIVLFAHGSGSSRHSPRNRYVAESLHASGIATILTDLLTAEEERIDSQTAELRFDIPLLAQRLIGIVDWASREPILGNLGLGCFGASTGAAAALVAAAERPRIVQAVVSRGGRPDLAGTGLRDVHAPSLFIVGGDDREVLRLNEWAIGRMPVDTEHKLAIVPRATHLFEEPGALERVASLARDWFQSHFS